MATVNKRILGNTISQYLEDSELAGYKIEHHILKDKPNGFTYLIKVGRISNNFCFQAVRQHKNTNSLKDEIIETLDELFTHIIKE